MSYSTKVKGELLAQNNFDKEEFLAVLAAIMKVSGTMSISGNKLGFKIITENVTTARFIYKNARELLKLNLELYITKSNSLKKRNNYIISFNELDDPQEFLLLTGILSKGDDGVYLDASIPYKFRRDEKIKKAYIKGTFLGSGSVSDPEKQYHLEFVTRSIDYAEDLKELLSEFGLKSNIVHRKGSQVVYIKEAEGIVDILNIIGAHNNLLDFENVRILKGFRNNINRIVNCETANLGKTVNAGLRQVESIKLIKEKWGLERLPQNLREIAELRIVNPNISLKELGELLDPPIGKSGINHRLRKLEKIAEELKM